MSKAIIITFIALMFSIFVGASFFYIQSHQEPLNATEIVFHSENLSAVQQSGITYDSTTRTVVIKNAGGTKLGEIQLISDLDYAVVDRGEDIPQTVAILRVKPDFDIQTSRLFDRFEFEDVIKNRAAISRAISFKYEVVTGSHVVPMYKSQCEQRVSQNGTEYTFCNSTWVYNRTVQDTTLNDLPATLQAGQNYYIHLLTDVKKGEKVEWYPYVFKDLGGIRINEWAVWTEALNSGLILYTTANQSNIAAGTSIINPLPANSGNMNCTVLNTIQSVSGKINASFNFTSAGSVECGIPPSSDHYNKNLTINHWFRMNSNTDYNPLWCTRTTGNRLCVFRNNQAGKLTISYLANEIIVIDEATYEDNAWHMLTLTHFIEGANKNVTLYMDGAWAGNALTANAIPVEDLGIGRQNAGGNIFDGGIDEFSMWNRTLTASEIGTDGLYNGGNGLTYDPNPTPPDSQAPNVTNTKEYPTETVVYSPVQNYQFNATIQDFNIDPDHVFLSFNGVNYTATNITNNVYNYTFSTLGAGNYSYYWIARDVAHNMNQSTTGSYNITRNGSIDTLTLYPTSPIYYPDATNFSCKNNYGLSSVLFVDNVNEDTFDGINATRGANNYVVSCNSTTNQNYTGNSTQGTYVIRQGEPNMSIEFNQATPMTFGAAMTPTCTALLSEVPKTLRKNGLLVTSGVPETLGAGTWTYNCSTQGSQNFTTNFTLRNFVVTQATGLVYTYINHSRADGYANLSMNWTINTTLRTGTFGSLTLKLNGLTVATSTSANLSYFYNFSAAGTYTFLSEYTGNQNYTSDTESWIVYIYDSIPPLADIYELPSLNDSEGLFSLFTYVNTVSDGIFFPIIILVIFIVMFISIMAFGSASVAWTASCFFAGILSIMGSIMGLIAPRYMYLALFGLAVGIVWITLENRG